MTAAKREAVCLLCVSRQKAHRILGASKCCSACCILSTHRFLNLLIHELDCGLDYAKVVVVTAELLRDTF